MGEFKELNADEICPCGSGKKYGDCCKRKQFCFGIQDGKSKMQKPVPDEVMELLEIEQKKFKEYYGREPGNGEYLPAFAPVYNDAMTVTTVYAMQEAGLPEEKIYAYYKSDSLLPTKDNLDMIPENALEEFDELCEEYKDLLAQETGESINILQFISFANSYLKSHLDYVSHAVSDCLNDLIRRHSSTLMIENFRMRTEKDYCLFSALKTIKTLTSVEILKGHQLSECIYALGRGIFENYMYICAVNAEENFFEDRLLPRADEENYVFETRPDGSVNYRKIIHKATGKTRCSEVSNKELKGYLPYEEDLELYNVFYSTACWYVHVDVLSAQSYFAVVDPYEEINPGLIAELTISAFVLLLLYQISQNRYVDPLFRSDAEHLCANLRDRLKSCLEIACADQEHPNAVLELLVKRLEHK